jgi:regulator of protease activity HflC (stomatin/prohibitin superfamily)
MAIDLTLGVGVGVLFIFIAIAIIFAGIRIIQPYEQGLLIVLGNFKRVLNPGFHWVIPIVSMVVRVDLRTQVIDVPRQEVITKDNSPTNVDAVIYIKVIEPKKSYFEVTNYKLATVALAQTTLRSMIGDMELDEVLYNRHRINMQLRDVLDEATDAWGVKVEAVEIREVDPSGPVKSAMEAQTAAERERRAAILKADGEKRAAILTAEGDKRARVLQAEGVKQAKILEAEGERLARILEAQGDAQKLRVLSVGALPLDQKALTVLSLDALKKIGDGKATKIIFPFEITKLLEGVADYVGAVRKIPEREVVKAEDLEKMVGKAEDVLGPIPSLAELRGEISTSEKEVKKEEVEVAKASEEFKEVEEPKEIAPPPEIKKGREKVEEELKEKPKW